MVKTAQNDFRSKIIAQVARGNLTLIPYVYLCDFSLVLSELWDVLLLDLLGFLYSMSGPTNRGGLPPRLTRL